MTQPASGDIQDGKACLVIGGTHKGKAGTLRDIHTSKTGQVTVTVVQAHGERFKTLARNVAVHRDDPPGAGASTLHPSSELP